MSKKHNKPLSKKTKSGAIPEKPAEKENTPYENLAKYTMIPPPGESDGVFPYSGS